MHVSGRVAILTCDEVFNNSVRRMMMKISRMPVVVAFIAVVGLFIAGCDSDASPEDLASAACSYEAECYEEETGEQYSQDEMEACEEEVEEFAAGWQDLYGQECLNAYDDWVSCVTGLACDDHDFSQCEEQEEVVDEICVGDLEEVAMDACLNLADCIDNLDEQDCHGDGDDGAADITPACEDALIDYNECLANASCAEIDDHYDFETEDSACDDEADVVGDAC